MPAAPLSVQLPADSLGKTLEDDPGMWSPTTNVRDQKKLLAPDSLAKPGLLQPFVK